MGYDRISFYYDSELYANAHDALFDIFEEISDELGFYYQLQYFEVLRIHQWGQIQDWFDKLITIQKGPTFKNLFKKLFISTTLIKKVYTYIVEFDTNYISDINFNQYHYKSLYQDMKEPCFKEYNDRLMSNETNYPSSEIIKLLNFYEERRVKGIELVIIVISAIIGGAIGAILAILFSTK